MKTLTLLRRSAAIVAAAGTLTLGFAMPQGEMAPPAAAQSSADLDRVVSALRGISTMKADFAQTDRAGNTARGTMTLKSPGKIRFDYGRDSDLLVISNGRSLYMVDYEVNQVERWPIRNSPLADPQFTAGRAARS